MPCTIAFIEWLRWRYAAPSLPELQMPCTIAFSDLCLFSPDFMNAGHSTARPNSLIVAIRVAEGVAPLTLRRSLLTRIANALHDRFQRSLFV